MVTKDYRSYSKEIEIYQKQLDEVISNKQIIKKQLDEQLEFDKENK